MGTLEASYVPSLESEIHLPYLLHPSSTEESDK
jgi:hypothetical protein